MHPGECHSAGMVLGDIYQEKITSQHQLQLTPVHLPPTIAAAAAGLVGCHRTSGLLLAEWYCRAESWL